MKQAIRAVGWATNILWIVVLVFTITVVYSAFQLRVVFAEPETSVTDETITVSLPFNISNGGFYEISNLNFTTRVKSDQEISISDSSTFVPLISSGENVTIKHNISMSLSDLLSKGLSDMLFKDCNLTADISLRIEYAGVIPLQISSNFSMPWGAPLYNLTLGNPRIEGIDLIIPISFENHSFFPLNGNMTLELLDNSNQSIGNGTAALDFLPQSPCNTQVRITVSGDPSRIREAYLHFYTPIFSCDYGPVVFPIA